MVKLNELLLTELHIVGEMSHMGGSVPLDYREYRRREALRSRKLLKFARRRSSRWDWTFYEITPAGRAALQQESSR